MSTTSERFGPWRIVGRHEGTLWRELCLARHETLAVHATLWVHRADLTRDEWLAAARRVSRDVRSGLLQLSEIGLGPGGAFVALTPAGRPLATVLSTPAPLEPRLAMAERLCASLAALHEAGLLHGDLVPDSVLVDDEGAVWLTPPGMGGEVWSGRDSPPRVWSYRVPDAEYDARSDVYGCGLLLYFLFYGRDAFAGDTEEAVRAAMRAGPAPAVGSADPRLSALQPVLWRALAPDPQARFQHGTALLAAFKDALDDMSARGAAPIEAPSTARTAGDEPLPVGAAPSGQEPESTNPPRPYDDNVQFTVYRPRTVQPGQWQPLLVFAHLAERRPDAPPDEPDPIEVVASQAAAILGDTTAYRTHGEDSSQPVPHEGELTFVPAAEGIEFNPPSRSFRWTETVHREEFRMRAGAGAAGRVVHGRVTVFLGAIVLAEIGMNLRVAASPSAAETGEISERARPYRKIFASYSHRDRAVVEEFSEYARAVGDRYLADVVDLRSGERWQPALERLIREADVFQLFWSWHALQSTFVRQEWQYALSLNRPRFVRPVYWDDPLPSQGDLPPAALRALHFERVRPARVPLAMPMAPAPAPAPPAAASQLPAPAPPRLERARPAPPASRRESAPPAPVPSQARAGWLRTALPAAAALVLVAVLVPMLMQQQAEHGSPGSPDGSVTSPGQGAVISVDATLHAARSAWAAGETDRALALFETAAAREPDHPAVAETARQFHDDVRHRLARAEAAAKARRVPPSQRRRAESRRARADLLLDEGRVGPALREMTAAAEDLERVDVPPPPR